MADKIINIIQYMQPDIRIGHLVLQYTSVRPIRWHTRASNAVAVFLIAANPLYLTKNEVTNRNRLVVEPLRMALKKH